MRSEYNQYKKIKTKLKQVERKIESMTYATKWPFALWSDFLLPQHVLSLSAHSLGRPKSVCARDSVTLWPQDGHLPSSFQLSPDRPSLTHRLGRLGSRPERVRRAHTISPIPIASHREKEINKDKLHHPQLLSTFLTLKKNSWQCWRRAANLQIEQLSTTTTLLLHAIFWIWISLSLLPWHWWEKQKDLEALWASVFASFSFSWSTVSAPQGPQSLFQGEGQKNN